MDMPEKHLNIFFHRFIQHIDFIQHFLPEIQEILDVEDQRDANSILIHHAGVSLFLRMSLNGTLFRGSDYMALLIREVKLPLEISLFVQFSDD